MKKLNSYRFIILMILIIGISSSCDDWVMDVDPLTSSIPGEELLDEEQLGVQLTGLLAQLGRDNEFSGWMHMMYRHAIFSDELNQDKRVPGGGAPDHAAFVQDTQFDLDFVEGDWENTQEIRWLADRLVKQVMDIEAGPGITNNAIKEECLWWGYVVGGMMRMILAEHYCLTKTGGPGAVITTIEQFENDDFGSFQTMAELHTEARARLTEALKYDPGASPGLDEGSHDRIVYSFIARTHLFDGSYAEAATAANMGLQEGDGPFQIVTSYQYQNGLWSQGRGIGQGYDSFRAHPRFAQYVVDDREEGELITALRDAADDPDNLTLSVRGYEGNDGEPGNRETEDPRAGIDYWERLPIYEIGLDFEDAAGGYTDLAHLTDLYTDRTDYCDIIDWREMQLILAEVAIRNDDLNTAVTHINNVRTAHNISSIAVGDLNNYDNEMGGANNAYWPDKLRRPHTNIVANKIDGPLGFLIEERDKTLWLKGTRIQDQWRFSLWHMGPDTWPLIPIPLSERIQNPNIPMDE